jgi:hypothetical protein
MWKESNKFREKGLLVVLQHDDQNNDNATLSPSYFTSFDKRMSGESLVRECRVIVEYLYGYGEYGYRRRFCRENKDEMQPFS